MNKVKEKLENINNLIPDYPENLDDRIISSIKTDIPRKRGILIPRFAVSFLIVLLLLASFGIITSSTIDHDAFVSLNVPNGQTDPEDKSEVKRIVSSHKNYSIESNVSFNIYYEITAPSTKYVYDDVIELSLIISHNITDFKAIPIDGLVVYLDMNGFTAVSESEVRILDFGTDKYHYDKGSITPVTFKIKVASELSNINDIKINYSLFIDDGITSDNEEVGESGESSESKNMVIDDSITILITKENDKLIIG